MADNNSQKVVRLEQLAKYKELSDAKYQDQALSEAITGLTATTVEGALAEIMQKGGVQDVSFEKLVTPNTGKLATYRFTKGIGAGQQVMDIDIEKDLVNGTFELVTITENDGHYYDGQTEVFPSQGVTKAGVYMKYNSNAASESPAYSYADMSDVVEYLTLGNQTGKTVTLSISNHQITADIADGAIVKAKLSQGVQESLNRADTAIQSHQDITGKADKSEMSITPGTGSDADKTTIQLKSGTSATVLTQHQDISGKQDTIDWATNADIEEMFE